MVPPEPQVRYFDARPPRRWWLVALVAVAVLVGVGAAVWFVPDLLRSDGTTDAGQLDTSGLPEGGADGTTVGADGTAPVGSVVLIDTDAESVVMVGDSITQGSKDAIVYTLAASSLTDVIIDGVPSRRIQVGDGTTENPEAGIDAIQRLLRAGVDPDVWVIALGTNDIAKYESVDDYALLITTVVALLPDDAPLVWVNAYRGDYPDESRQFDEVLADTLRDRDRTAVLDWAALASAPDQQVLRDDDVHPNPEGRAAFARLVASGIEQVG
jgi:lysophospholipase L1-like esterase